MPEPGPMLRCVICGEPIGRETPWMSEVGPCHLRCLAAQVDAVNDEPDELEP